MSGCEGANPTHSLNFQPRNPTDRDDTPHGVHSYRVRGPQSIGEPAKRHLQARGEPKCVCSIPSNYNKKKRWFTFAPFMARFNTVVGGYGPTIAAIRPHFRGKNGLYGNSAFGSTAMPLILRAHRPKQANPTRFSLFPVVPKNNDEGSCNRS